MKFNERGWIPSLTALIGIIVLVVYAYFSGMTSGPKKLESAKALWENNRLDSYQYILKISCFCPEEYTQAVQVQVHNGRFFNAEGSTVMVTDDYIIQFGTVEALFTVLEKAYKDGADEVDVEYDPTYGVPLRFSIDQDIKAVDDEMSLEITSFEILTVDEE